MHSLGPLLRLLDECCYRNQASVRQRSKSSPLLRPEFSSMLARLFQPLLDQILASDAIQQPSSLVANTHELDHARLSDR